MGQSARVGLSDLSDLWGQEDLPKVQTVHEGLLGQEDRLDQWDQEGLEDRTAHLDQKGLEVQSDLPKAREDR